MAERLGGAELSIEASEVKTDAQVAQYYRERVRRIHNGEAVWIVRNFDSDTGRVYDFYEDLKLKGFVQHEYDGSTFNAYRFSDDDNAPEPVAVELGNLSGAQEFLVSDLHGEFLEAWENTAENLESSKDREEKHQ